MSRSPVDQPTEEDEEAELEIEDSMKQIVNIAIQCISEEPGNNTDQDQMLEMIAKAVNEDNEYKLLRETILSGLPDHKTDWNPLIRSYFNVKNKLTVDNEF